MEQAHPLERWLDEQRRTGNPVRKYQLAKQVKCSSSRLTQIIRDREMPSSALAGRIKAVTGISTDEIIAAATAREPGETVE